MKKWNNPSIEELDLNATAYSPAKGSHIDGTYKSYDGEFTHHSYAPSGGDSGEPHLAGNHPGMVPKDGSFVNTTK